MTIRYLSVCSGIEAATVAWAPLGWRAAAFSEIEKFPAAVLAHHYPAVPNLGDLTAIKGEDYHGLVDLLVGGTPCQSFSVAGLRGGLDDPRGQLTLAYFRLAGRLRPRWLVWENVPGVLSDDGGRTFGTVLGSLVELGYGFAYRVLDAQYFGVPQRRRRVFLVGYPGDWRPAAAVLFERHSLSGDSPPRCGPKENLAGAISKCSFSGGSGGRPEGAAGNHFIPVTAGALTHRYGQNGEAANGDLDGNRLVAHCLSAHHHNRHNYSQDTCIIAHTLRGEAYDAGETGDGRANLIPINLQVATRHTALGEKTGLGIGEDGDPMFTLSSAHSHGVFFEDAVAFQEAQTGCREYDTAGTLRAGGPGHDPVGTRVRCGAAVRRLTPTECERLQGFPDDYTLIPWRGKSAADCPDGPRYKGLGNSMAVPVMRWIGERIQMVDEMVRAE